MRELFLCITKQTMKKQNRPYSHLTQQALILLGKQIRLARKQHKMTEIDLGERAGISRSTVRNIELGNPKVAIGLVLETAVIVGVPLFRDDNNYVTGLVGDIERLDDKLRLLPQSIRSSNNEVDDDF